MALIVPGLERVVEVGVHFAEMTLFGIVASNILMPSMAFFFHFDRLDSPALSHRT